jgi:transposase
MEPTAGYWEPLFFYLKGLGFDVRLVSSLKVRHFKDVKDNSPLKSDRKDAQVIAQLLKDGNVLDYRVSAPDYQKIKDILYTILDFQKTEGVYKNRLESLLATCFPELLSLLELGSPTMKGLLRTYPLPSDIVMAGWGKISDLLHKASGGKLSKEKAKQIFEAALNTVGNCNDDDIMKWRFESILDQLDSLSGVIKKGESKLEENLAGIPQAAILRSIEGIGLINAAAITAVIGDLKEYKSAAQVIKKAGLNLYSLSSGKRKGRDHISKRGRSILRRCLYMAALQHTQKGKSFYPKYCDITDNGKRAKRAGTALVAIMRKLLKVAFALVRDNRKFESDYAHKPGAERDGTVIRRAESG